MKQWNKTIFYHFWKRSNSYIWHLRRLMIIWIFVKKSFLILSGIKALIINPHIFSNSQISLLLPLLSISHLTNGLPSLSLLTDDPVSTHSQSANQRPVLPPSTNQRPWLRQLKCVAGGRSWVKQTIKITAVPDTNTARPCQDQSGSCKILAGRWAQHQDEHVTRGCQDPSQPLVIHTSRLSIKHCWPLASDKEELERIWHKL